MSEAGSELDLEAIQGRLRPMWERIARAEKELAAVTRKAWYFALLGFDADFEQYDVLGELAQIRGVAEPPDPMYLQFAADSPYGAGAVSRYSRGIRFELVLPASDSLSDEKHLTLAWQIISAIRLSSLAELLIPAVSDYPWSTLPAIKDNRARIRPIEDVPQAHVLTPGSKVTIEHLAWVATHFVSFMDLIERPRFRLASEALSTHHLQHGRRMMAANIWAGIEALVDVQTELRFRLSAFLAALLEPPGPARRALYKRIQKLYDLRSKVVHGAAVEEAAIRDHTIEARTLLARVMRNCVERNALVTCEDFERALFEGAT
jgi:hypothetical protein